jgi:hypothetical protein
VDGASHDKPMFKHTHTFDALGYVQVGVHTLMHAHCCAGVENATQIHVRFTGAYIFVHCRLTTARVCLHAADSVGKCRSEESRHWREGASRGQKSARDCLTDVQITSKAVQKVLSLDTQEQIMGAAAFDDVLIVLDEAAQLFAAVMRS